MPLARPVCFCMVVVISLMASAGYAATPLQVDEAIKKGVAYLYSQEKNGTWENLDAPSTDPKIGGPASADGMQWGGNTGICTYALLASGEDPQDPRIDSAVKYL